MKLTPTMTYHFIFNMVKDLFPLTTPYIVDTDIAVIQGEKIQIKSALDKEFDAVITIHENIVLHFERHFLTRDKMEIRRSVYVYPEQLPKLIQSMVIPVEDSLCVVPGDPIMQVGNLIKAIDQDREEMLALLKCTYISRRKLHNN